MNAKIYRWAKLSEALRIQDGDMPNKYLYRIDDKSEASFYAHVNKMHAKNARWSILQANIHIPNQDIVYMTENQYLNIEKPLGKKFLSDKIGIYDLGVFRLFLIPPKFQSIIKNPRIVEVV
jgi:hypothetical protein